MIRAALSVLALTASLLGGTSATAAPAPQWDDTCAQFTVDFPAEAFEGKRVVLVLHGWTGKSQDDTVSLLREELPEEDWAVAPFAFASSNADWPAPDSLAVRCLRNVISQYGGATGLAGPAVYLVGHSMGGILSRVALTRDLDDNVDGEKTLDYSPLVGGIITVDTPHKGSPWGSSVPANFAQWWNKGGRVGGASAAKCLALHHPGTLPSDCYSPPAVSPSVPVYQVAGVVTLTRDLLMIAREEVDTNSDGIVWLESQVGYATSMDAPPPDTSHQSSSVVRCDFESAAALGFQTTSAVGGAIPVVGDIWEAGENIKWMDGTVATAMQSGTPSFLRHPAAIAVLTGAGSAPCGHMKIMTNPEAIDIVAGKLLEWADDPSGTGFTGTWTGPIDQPGSIPYTVEVIIEQDANRQYIANVRYPELNNCSGYWDDITVTGNVMTATETITDRAGRCVSTVPLELTLIGDTISYLVPYGGDSNITGTLTRSMTRAPGSVELPAGASWLYTLSTGGTSTSGDQDTAHLAAGEGTFSYPNSANQWVSCNSSFAEGNFGLGGSKTKLSLGLGIQAHAPERLGAEIQITGDGKPLWAGSVTRGSVLQRIDLDVTGVEELTVLARKTSGGTCGYANKGWAALVQAYVQ